MKCSRPDAQMIRKLVDAAPDGIVVFAGNEAIALGSLALGADALISGLSTAIPEPFVAMTQALDRRDLGMARSHQQVINRLLALMPAGARIGAIKRILQQRGIDVGPAVPPRPTPELSGLWESMQSVLG
jgi:dihydrodipicolinate synthase/N-acetylneuraminate lyase